MVAVAARERKCEEVFRERNTFLVCVFYFLQDSYILFLAIVTRRPMWLIRQA